MIENRDYYFATEIPGLLNDSTPSYTTFYRCVKNNKIRKFTLAGQDVYSKLDVDTFLRGGMSRNKKSSSQRESTSEDIVKAEPAEMFVTIPKFVRSEEVKIRSLTNSDIGAVYHLQFEEIGFENAIQPTSMRKWVEDGVPIFWVACSPQKPNDIWATIGVLPLDEELIVRFLRGEFTLQEIAITDVLSYQTGQDYTCYVVVAAGSNHQDALIKLMEYLLDYWCDHYPDISIKMLYASSPTNMEETPLLHMVKTFFFSRRRDISASRGVWELPLDEYNPAPAIQHFQKCIKEKGMFTLERNTDVTHGKSGHPFSSPLRYRAAKTREDVAAMVQIGAEIFVPPGAQPSISNDYQIDVWYSWLVKNPEIFHVVTDNNDIIGYISMIPLHTDMIDKIIRGAHPTTITSNDVLVFEPPDEPLDIYVHIWGTTPRLTATQKRYASAKMLKELRKTFEDYARRGIDIRFIYTRSNKKDGIEISQHLGMEDLHVPGVTDAPDPADRKHVFRVDTTHSSNPFLVQYRHALEEYRGVQERQVSNS